MGKILIVDDDPDAAEALCEVAEAEGHSVRVAYDGVQGFERARERIPDLVLLDVDMPRLDGPGMAYAMFWYDMGLEGIPIVLVSGAPNLQAIAERVRTTYFLRKPCSYEDLVAMIARALAERRGPISAR